jgi:hypothetical protein
VIPATQEAYIRGSQSEIGLGKRETLSEKQPKHKKARNVAQVLA